MNQDPDRQPSAKPSLLSRDQLRIVAPLLSSSRQVIDIGCSSGTFLRHAIDHASAAESSYGVEISEPNRRAAQRAGLRVERELVDVAPDAVVTMWHSAEHFPIPALIELWSELRQRCSERTRLVVSVPNGRSLQWRVFRSRWTYFDPGAHYSQFSPRSLDTVAAAAGWRVAGQARTPVYGGFGAIQSSINLLRPHNEIYEAMKRGSTRLTPTRVALSALAAVVTMPLTATVLLGELSTQLASVTTHIMEPA